MPRLTAKDLKGGTIVDVEQIDLGVGPMDVLTVQMPRKGLAKPQRTLMVLVQSDPEGNDAGYLQINALEEDTDREDRASGCTCHTSAGHSDCPFHAPPT